MEKYIPWKEARQNLLAFIEKYPTQAMNVIDSAYLAGLDANRDETISQCLKILEDEIATAHTLIKFKDNSGKTSRLTSAYNRISKLKQNKHA